LKDWQSFLKSKNNRFNTPPTISRSQALETVKVFTIQLKNAVIPAWMLESSHRDVKPREE
jgi:hypothetical protein